MDKKVEITFKKSNINFLDIWRSYGIVGIFIIFFIILSFSSDVFLTFNNQINILKQASVLGVASLGVFITLLAGNLDLSVGSLVGFSAVVCAKIALTFGIIPALILTFLIASTIGFINGFLSTRGKGLSIIITLSMKFIIYSGTLFITQARPIVNLPKGLLVPGKFNIGPIPLSVIILILFIFIFWLFTTHFITGRKLYAVGGNDIAARFSGLPVKKLIILTFIISGFCAAVAGLILMGRVASAQPSAGAGMELDVVGAILLGGASLSGGRGTVRGTIIGVLLFGLINNGLNLLGISPFFRDAVKGGVILFAILIDQWGRE